MKNREQCKIRILKLLGTAAYSNSIKEFANLVPKTDLEFFEKELTAATMLDMMMEMIILTNSYDPWQLVSIAMHEGPWLHDFDKAGIDKWNVEERGME